MYKQHDFNFNLSINNLHLIEIMVNDHAVKLPGGGRNVDDQNVDDQNVDRPKISER
jgi:hypothetical protein